MMETKNRKKNSLKMLIADLCICVVAILFDQLTKVRIRATLPVSSSFDVIPGVLEILHHENSGASWGLMKGQTTFFVIIGVIVAVGLIIFVPRIPDEKKFLPLNIASAFIMAGDLGNTIDRIDKKTVTDFIYVSCINFPIFNVADIYIVVATLGLAALILFVYKEEDLRFIEFRKKEPDTDPEKQDKAEED